MNEKFDRFADAVAEVVASPFWFIACVALVVVWAPSILVFGNVDTWQLIINTTTTIITFLLVALLQNTQYRDMQALQKKLNALVEAMADSLESHSGQDPTVPQDVEELRRASGLEDREGT